MKKATHFPTRTMRLPIQSAPISRDLASAGVSDDESGVAPSQLRHVACSVAASAAGKLVGKRGADALYNYCMGPGGL